MGRGRLDGPRPPLGLGGMLVWALAIVSALAITWWDLTHMAESGAFEEASEASNALEEDTVDFELAPIEESVAADAGAD